MIVAIDGHAGSGKSSLGKRLARDEGMLFIDTGAMYRAVALVLLRRQDPGGLPPMEELMRQLPIVFEPGADAFRVRLDGKDVTDELRDGAVGKIVSGVAAQPPVRQRMTELARGFAALGDLVVDGRDIGTVVFPDADVKVFLTASPEVRARRRHQDRAGGGAATVQQTLDELRARDSADSSRSLAPLAQAADAVVIDTTNLDLESAYHVLRDVVRSRRKSG